MCTDIDIPIPKLGGKRIIRSQRQYWCWFQNQIPKVKVDIDSNAKVKAPKIKVTLRQIQNLKFLKLSVNFGFDPGIDDVDEVEAEIDVDTDWKVKTPKI